MFEKIGKFICSEIEIFEIQNRESSGTNLQGPQISGNTFARYILDLLAFVKDANFAKRCNKYQWNRESLKRPENR